MSVDGSVDSLFDVCSDSCEAVIGHEDDVVVLGSIWLFLALDLVSVFVFVGMRGGKGRCETGAEGFVIHEHVLPLPGLIERKDIKDWDMSS